MGAANRVRVCSASEFAAGTARRFTVGGTDVCVTRCDDGFHAVADLCSHEDYSLAEGEVDASACEIECWKHGSLFSLVTGEPLTLPATRPIRVFEVVVEGDDLSVILP